MGGGYSGGGGGGGQECYKVEYFFFYLAVALTTACSAARSATLLGIVPTATAEVEEVAMVVEDTVEEDMEVVPPVEEAEVCSFLSLDGLPRSLSALHRFDTNSPFA